MSGWPRTACTFLFAIFCPCAHIISCDIHGVLSHRIQLLPPPSFHFRAHCHIQSLRDHQGHVTTMAPTVKKGTPKASTKNNGIAAKPHVSAHPSWIDMIKVSQRSPPARQISLSCLALAHLLYLGMYHCQFCRQSRRCLTSYDQKGPCPLSSSPLFCEVDVAPSSSNPSITSRSIMLPRPSLIELSMPVSSTKSSRFRKVGYLSRKSSTIVFTIYAGPSGKVKLAPKAPTDTAKEVRSTFLVVSHRVNKVLEC